MKVVSVRLVFAGLFAFLLTACASRVERTNAIFDAVTREDLDETRRLIASDPALVKARDAVGRSLLHAAAGAGKLGAVELLLASGANSSVQNRKGATPLHAAAWNGHTEVLKALIAHGGNVYAADAYGRTALTWALIGYHEETAKYLQSQTNTLDFASACILGDRGTVAKCIASRPDLLKYTDDLGYSALHLAVLGKQPRVVSMLLWAGADRSLKDLNKETAYVYAERISQTATLKAFRRFQGQRLAMSWGLWLTVVAVAAGGQWYVARRRRCGGRAG